MGGASRLTRCGACTAGASGMVEVQFGYDHLACTAAEPLSPSPEGRLANCSLCVFAEVAD